MLLQNNTKKRLWMFAGGLVVLALISAGILAYSIWQTPSTPVSSSNQPSPKPPINEPALSESAQGTQPASLSVSSSTKAASPSEAPAPAEAKSSENLIPVAGNLGKVTALRADLEEIRLKVAIAQEAEKLHPKPTPTPQPQLSIPLSEVPRPAPVKHKESSPVVVSVQGVDGNATATIRSGSGVLETVRPGDRYNGGVVSAVNRSGVSVRRGSSTTTLIFE
jgi:type IV pilus biogenesis protein PilP